MLWFRQVLLPELILACSKYPYSEIVTYVSGMARAIDDNCERLGMAERARSSTRLVYLLFDY